MKRSNAVPEVWQQAARLAVAVSGAMATGALALQLVVPDNTFLRQQIKDATSGAGITCAFGQAPVMGVLAQVGVQRFLGSLLGGLSGYGIFKLGAFWLNDRADWYFRAACAPVIAAAGVVFGGAVDMATAGKLVLLCYILVTVSINDQAHALTWTVTRMGGVIVGLLWLQIAQVLVFPKSASTDAIWQLREVLLNVSKLNQLVWRTVAAQEDGPDGVEEGLDARDGHVLIRGLEDYLSTECERLQSEIHRTLYSCEANIEVARHEIFLCRARQLWCFLPGFTCGALGRWQLPKDKTLAAVIAMRRITRLLYAIWLLFQDGFGERMRLVLAQQYPAQLLTALDISSVAAIQDMIDGFPDSPILKTANLTTFVQAVLALGPISARIKDAEGGDLIAPPPDPQPPPSPSPSQASNPSEPRQAPTSILGSAWAFGRQAVVSRLGGRGGSGGGGKGDDLEEALLDGEVEASAGDVSESDAGAGGSAGGGASAGATKLSFPDTEFGQVLRVRWHTFHFMMHQVATDLKSMNAALTDLLMDLP